MLLEVFRLQDKLPNGAGGSILTLKLHPKPGEAWRAFTSNYAIQWQGSLVTKGAGFTSLQCRMAPSIEALGGDDSVEANIGSALSAANGIQRGTSYMVGLVVDFFQTGTSANDDTSLYGTLAMGFPVERVEVLVARTGFPFDVGANLADHARYGRVLAW